MKSKDSITANFPFSQGKHIFTRFCSLKSRFLFILKITVCLLLVSLSILSFLLKEKHTSLIYIYNDPASLPALLQMVDAIKAPSSAPKLFIWNRFKTINTYANLDTLSAKTIRWDQSINEQIKTFVDAYPNRKIVIHYNLTHSGILESLLKIIPPERIQEVHAYEDASGGLWWNRLHDDIIKSPTPYPAIFHVVKSSLLTQPICMSMKQCSWMKDLLKDKRVEEINLKKLAVHLTKEEKEKLYQLLNLDVKKLQPLFSKQPVILFVSGFNWHAPQKDINQFYLFKEACTQKIKNQSPKKPYIWLFKSHPAYPIDKAILQYLRKDCPGIVEIPAHLPFEALILAGLTPDKTAGYSSSLFFNLDSKDILFYIPRINDPYLPVLKELKKITEKQIISLSKIQSEIETDIVSIFINHPSWSDHMIFKTPSKVCRLFKTDECGSVLHQTPEEITIKWEHWGKETFYHQPNGVWTLSPTDN